MLTLYYMKELISDIDENIKIKEKLKFENETIEKIILKIFKTLKSKNRVFICGNGGSAADAQHIAAEFLVQFKKNNKRKPYPVISLALDPSTLTACGNDLGFEYIYSRNLEALSSKKDLLLLLSTSGNSQNLINAAKFSQKNNIFTIGLLGSKGGTLKKYCNISLIVDSNDTARIQEAHIFIGHFIVKKVENLLIETK